MPEYSNPRYHFSQLILAILAHLSQYNLHMPSHFTFTPVGIVHSRIREPVDDVWGGVTSRIELDSSRFAPDCLKGLEEFSHVEIVFTFHRIPDSEVYFGARRPRGAFGLAGSGHFRSTRSEEHTSELQSHSDLVCRLL